MSPVNTHKPIRIYIGGLILGVNTLYMLSCFFKLFAVVGNELTRVHSWMDYRACLRFSLVGLAPRDYLRVILFSLLSSNFHFGLPTRPAPVSWENGDPPK